MLVLFESIQDYVFKMITVRNLIITTLVFIKGIGVSNI